MAWATPGPHFTPSVLAGYLYDTNLFRVPDAEAIEGLTGTTEESDSVATYGVGVDMRLPISRQLLELQLEAARKEYDRYSFLDHTAVDGRGRWAWEYGSLWSGELRLRYREDIASFEEFRQAEKDERTLWEVFGSAYRRLDLRWTAGLSLARRELDHGLERRRNLNREMTLVAGELIYIGMSESNSTVGLRAEYRRSAFPNREPIAANAVDDSHQEYEIAGTLTWDATPRSAFVGRLGFAMADHEFSERDFTGIVGLARYDYVFSERTGVEVSVWRDLNTRTDTDASYVVDAGISLSPHWKVGAHTTLEAILSHTRRSYEGDPALQVSDLPTRRDRLNTAGTAVAWVWRDTVEARLSWRWESRDSNREDREYLYQLVAGEVRLSF